ncbi:neuronal acetylcholine receptor subunit alpha-3-like [Mizuhopecten yessoensis]|uniref:neuronal acetylcholine receptor subunit alpha-3-like n=1 Tax=Mizuhopecten yessoensis TaxID=6573 RepID=UPI000B458DB4|nr:neuronal acetylcholine receptor subunit alpha-3-like [Mizuhopecten yessoensis]
MVNAKEAPRALQWGFLLFLCTATLIAAQRGGAKSIKSPALYSRDLEAALRELLFTNYSRLQRPTEKVDVTLWLTLLTVNDMIWRDDRLDWSSMTDFTNVRNLFATQQELWRPTLVVDNSITDLSVISNNDIPMRILKRGLVYWRPADVYVVACESDITYYPMDMQSCVISLSSWAYTNYEVSLRMSPREVVTDFYTKNGEWEMISCSGDKTEALKSRGGTTYSNLKFTINLRRRPLFHILNTLFPVVLMAFLSAMVFKLPADSGEKIGFSLTVLLAYTVYLTLISENIPSTSVTVSYLSIYLSITMSLGTLAVLCTILVLNMHYREAEGQPIPAFARSFTICLMRLTCSGGCCRFLCNCKKNRRVSPEKNLIINVVGLEHLTKRISEKKTVEENEGCVCEHDKEVLTWIHLAKVLDSFFFIVFIGVILVISTAFFSVMVAEYMKIKAEGSASV